LKHAENFYKKLENCFYLLYNGRNFLMEDKFMDNENKNTSIALIVGSIAFATCLSCGLIFIPKLLKALSKKE